MKYGYFNDESLEYVITHPDTPAPWANYLGNPEFGSIISNNAGGYCFEKSGADGRLIRYLFNGSDTPGRYIYLKDKESKDYWSASWQPVLKDLKDYHTETRVTPGITTIASTYSQIESEVSFYVPEDYEPVEVWFLRVKNTSERIRKLTVTGFCEFTNHGNYEQDQVNLQYSRFINSTRFEGNRVVQVLHGNLEGTERGSSANNVLDKRFFGLAGSKVSHYTGDRTDFLGRYRSYGNPVGVADGLHDTDSYNEYSCGALATEIVLNPDEERTMAFVLGGSATERASSILKHYENTSEACNSEMGQIRALWRDRFESLQVKTPDADFNSMINVWNAYNCFMTFTWSRAASFVYCGLRNGYGYRDTVQDIQGVIHLKPEEAAEKIRFMLTAQVHHGAGLPLVKFTHNPGHEDTPEDESYRKSTGHPAYRADDALWLFPTVYKYVAETGNIEFLNEMLPFADRDIASVYEHLKRALNFSEDHLGPHGLPAGLYADWNDCLRLGASGESTFVAFQFLYAYALMEQMAEALSDEAYAKEVKAKREALAEKIQNVTWNVDRYIRGFKEEGGSIGNRDASEANMWLNPQSWAVISGAADETRGKACFDLVFERLNTEYGVVLMDPPFKNQAFDGALAVIYNQGTKENSGIFSQTQGWAILAESLLGEGNRAFKIWKENSPASQNELADIRQLEPYAYGQFTEGSRSPHFGRSHVHWLTGTASTMMVGCVEGILGLRPDFTGLRISPSIPSDWAEFEMNKVFRGKKLHITVKNPGHKESGFVSMTVNEQMMKDNYIKAEMLKEENEIVLVIS